MTPRPRRKGNKDLPVNLYASIKNGRTYYQYKHPITGKFEAFGSDKKEAVDAAKQINEVLSKPSNLVNKILKTQNPFVDYLNYYSNTVIPAKRINGFPLSKRTIDEQSRIIKHLANELGHIDLAKITQAQIADYLNQRSSAEVFNKHRSILVMIFRQAISDGIIEKNLPERILKRDQDIKKRARLTLNEYKRIYQHARPAIRNAMELSLNALQRRADIQTWRFDCEKDGFYYIIQSKTKKHGKSAYLRIPKNLPVAYSAGNARTLADIVKQCRSQSACQYLIHEQRQRQCRSKEKTHPLQLSPKQISNGFAEARKKAGITGANPPTFHELLSLGQELREKQGWMIKEIQTLRGHTSEKMTMHYLDDRDWTTVDIPAVHL